MNVKMYFDLLRFNPTLITEVLGSCAMRPDDSAGV